MSSVSKYCILVCNAEIENEMCVYGVYGNPSLSPSITEPCEFLGWHWGTSSVWLWSCAPFPQHRNPPAQGHRGGFTLQSKDHFHIQKVAWGNPRCLSAYRVKPTKPLGIIWATLFALCSHRQNYKHIRVSFCSSEGKLPHVYLLLISSSFLLAGCWRADSKRKTWFPSCYTLVELSPKCKTKIRM